MKQLENNNINLKSKSLIFEIISVLRNKLFLGSCFIEVILTTLYSITTIIKYKEYTHQIIEKINNGTNWQNPMLNIESIFNFWIGSPNTNAFKTIFFYFFPLISGTIYSWIYIYEKKSGNIPNIKKQQFRYYVNKYIVNFFSAGLVIFIPIMTSIFIMLPFIPITTPDSAYDIYFDVFSDDFMANIFYTYPILYLLFDILLIVIYAGFVGGVCFSLSVFFENRIAAVVIPYLSLLFIHYKNNIETNISPISFLSSTSYLMSNIKTYIIEILILLSVSIVILLLCNNRISEE